MIREAMFYEKAGESGVRCKLCPHCCYLKVGESGKCRGRKNSDGRMIAVNYSLSIGLALDPIEKKPLYHFRPGSQIMSLGANSCNLSCFFCQNFSSSQENCLTGTFSVNELYTVARKMAGPKQVAFTYTEPFTWYEYIHDFAELAKDVDIVLVTNGYVNPAPLAEILPFIRAMNIDLKSIKQEFYRQYCGAELETVLNTIREAYKAGVHLELTNLLIPGLNDTDAEISELAEFIATVGKDIPLHISAYHPAYKSEIPATTAKAVIHACEIASHYLHYVYAGNIRAAAYNVTSCPECGKVLVPADRARCEIDAEGNCSYCGQQIYGVF